MFKIRIGETERDLRNTNESWIVEQINRRLGDGQSVCVRVFIEKDGVDMVLSTPNCPLRGAGGRTPNMNEKKIFKLWEKCHLDRADYMVRNLIAFLKQLNH